MCFPVTIDEHQADHMALKCVIPMTSVLSNTFTEDNISLFQNAFWVPVNSHQEGNNIKSLLTSSLYQYLESITRITINFPSIFLKNLPDVRDKSYSNSEIYSLFNLTPEEIKLIES